MLVAGIAAVQVAARGARAVEMSARNRAAATITPAEAQDHLRFLSDDTLEGREAGSRGGRAAAIYLVDKFEKAGLKSAGSKGFYQSFGAGYSNILGSLPGSDPSVAHQTIVVGAHYDHVGYGTRNNSYGPIGQIHNGADDNASGVAGLLEIIDACRQLPQAPRRTILFACWDGEEKGLLGSKHWLDHSTVPLQNVVFAFNSDMMGRLRDDQVEVIGCRTSGVLRRLVTQQNLESGLALDFSWEMKENSDHHPFAVRRIPILMFYTGMHDDYHRPSDDADRINYHGLARVDQLVLRTLFEVADAPTLPRFRPAALTETPGQRDLAERPAPGPPARLGLWWDPGAIASGRLEVAQLEPRSPAARAGFRRGDRVLSFAGQTVDSAETFRRAVAAAPQSTVAVVSRPGRDEPLELAVRLEGGPLRIGISWRVDECEESMVAVANVVPGSPAAEAGLHVNDRIYAVNGQEFRTSAEFGQLLGDMVGPFDMLVETRGRLRSVSLTPLAPLGAAPDAPSDDAPE